MALAADGNLRTARRRVAHGSGLLGSVVVGVAQHALYVTRDQVDFEVHLGACGQLAQGGVLHGMRDQVDAELRTAFIAGQVGDAVDRQAHAIDGDGALVGQVFAEFARSEYAQLPAFADFGEVRDTAYAVDMYWTAC